MGLLERCVDCSTECLLYKLSRDAFRELAISQGARRRYGAGRVLFAEGERCQGVLLICSGFAGSFWGRAPKQCAEILGRGDWVGEECSEDGIWLCEATALTDLAGWWLEEAQWQELVNRFELRKQFLRHQAEHILRLCRWQVVLAYGSVRARMAWQLVHLAERFGQAEGDKIFVPLRLTQQQQADLVGATRQAVTLVLKEFQEHGWLRCERDGVWVLNHAGLVEQIRQGLGFPF